MTDTFLVVFFTDFLLNKDFSHRLLRSGRRLGVKETYGHKFFRKLVGGQPVQPPKTPILFCDQLKEDINAYYCIFELIDKNLF